MSELLTWDQTGEKKFRTGIKKVVLFPMASGVYGNGVPWSGVTAVNEEPSGAEPQDFYADDVKYLSIMSTEKFAATIEAYMYPDEFAECDGSAQIGNGLFATAQRRKPFGLAYRTTIGNDTDEMDYGYEIHLVYNALAAPSSKSNSSVNENVDIGTMSWSLSTTPVPVPGKRPSAHIVINSTKATAAQMAALEAILYGATAAGGEPAVQARLPLPAELITLFPEMNEGGQNEG